MSASETAKPGATSRPEYFGRFPRISFERNADGVLVMRLHTNQGPAIFDFNYIDEIRDAFTALSLDLHNKVLVFTATGEWFFKEVDFASFGDLSNALNWSIVAAKERRMLQSCLDVEIPVVAAINGPIPFHSELALLADVVISDENAWFQDTHLNNDVAPGDGIHTAWIELLGINRARTFLMLGRKLTAREAHGIGVVAELAPHAGVLARAQALAIELAAKPALSLRNARLALTGRLSRTLAEGLSYGLPLQGMSMVSDLRRTWPER